MISGSTPYDPGGRASKLQPRLARHHRLHVITKPVSSRLLPGNSETTRIYSEAMRTAPSRGGAQRLLGRLQVDSSDSHVTSDTILPHTRYLCNDFQGLQGTIRVCFRPCVLRNRGVLTAPPCQFPPPPVRHPTTPRQRLENRQFRR
jgi:hypothetical protein